MCFERFTGHHVGGAKDAAALVSRAWDLDRIGREYREFMSELHPVVDRVDEHGDMKSAFTARFHLVHSWRTFLFRDPGLPPDLLPARWPGTKAAEFFDTARRSTPARRRPVRRTLPEPPHRRPRAARRLRRPAREPTSRDAS